MAHLSCLSSGRAMKERGKKTFNGLSSRSEMAADQSLVV